MLHIFKQNAVWDGFNGHVMCFCGANYYVYTLKKILFQPGVCFIMLYSMWNIGIAHHYNGCVEEADANAV